APGPAGSSETDGKGPDEPPVVVIPSNPHAVPAVAAAGGRVDAGDEEAGPGSPGDEEQAPLVFGSFEEQPDIPFLEPSGELAAASGGSEEHVARHFGAGHSPSLASRVPGPASGPSGR